MLCLDKITKAFGSKMVIDNVSLSLVAGEIICLHGPSGAGKTTLLEIAAGLVHPDRGRRLSAFTRIGYLFQDDVLIPWLTVRRNIQLTLSGYYAPGEALLLADKWMSRLGLIDLAELRPSQISGGQRRRTGLARALAVQPDLIILDEPFAFLDDYWVDFTSDLIREQSKKLGTAVLMASHPTRPLKRMQGQIIEVRAPIRWP